MKKYYLLFLILFLPFTVSAKEYCRVVSGDGKSVGSEIVCGEEHFNVLSSNDNEIRMLAKYNLLVGSSISKYKIEKESNDTRTDAEYCLDLASNKGGILRNDEFYDITSGYCYVETLIGKDVKVYHSSITDISGNEGWSYLTPQCNAYYQTSLGGTSGQYEYNAYTDFFYDSTAGVYACYYTKDLGTQEYRQDSEAISAHWDEDDNFLYPQVGDTYISGIGDNNSSSVQSDLVCDSSSSSKYDGYFYDLTVRNGSQFYNYLNSYKSFLNSRGYDVNSIDLITLDDVTTLIRNNNHTISYSDWYDASSHVIPPRYEFVFLQDYLQEKETFIFNTTYWLRTGYNLNFQDDLGVQDVVFIDERGGICGSNVPRQNYRIPDSANCSYKIAVYLKSSVGTGIRPVITIPNEVEYSIEKETNGEGDIEVVSGSLPGEVITFRATPTPGYKLMSVVVKRENGQEIEISADDLIENPDGTITILNKFTMPAENVVIYARWVSISELINPTTGSIFLFMTVILSLVGLVFYKKAKRV